MGEAIPPALDAEEWRDGLHAGPDLTVQIHRAGINGRPRLNVLVHASPVNDPRDLHAAAAMALHGQPFGFTWADVDRHLSCADHAHSEARALRVLSADVEYDTEARWHESMAARIAALLPPRDRK